MVNKIEIGKKLKEERMKRSISLETLAQDTGISRSTLSRYESDGITDIEKISNICLSLQISPNYLLNFSDYEETNELQTLNKKIIYDTTKYDVIANNSFEKVFKQINVDVKMGKSIFCFTNDNRIFENTFETLQKYKYDIKYLDFTNLDMDGYNPIKYIKTERDVIEFSNYFINLYKKDNNLNLLFCSLISYLCKYRSLNEQNLTSVMKLLRAANIDEKHPNIKSPLDRIFDEVEERDPSSSAVKQYKTFLTCSNNEAKNKISELANLLLLYDVKEIEEFMINDTVNLDEIDNNKTIIFIIPPIDSVLSQLYEAFKYQLFKILKVNSIKSRHQIKNEKIEKFFNSKRRNANSKLEQKQIYNKKEDQMIKVINTELMNISKTKSSILKNAKKNNQVESKQKLIKLNEYKKILKEFEKRIIKNN